MLNMPDFIKDADNIYRTKHYIVKQFLVLDTDLELGSTIISEDTFYKRTKKRDKEYECIFAERKFIDGKRITATMSKRKYID